MIEPCVVRPCGHLDQLVAVQVREGELLPAQQDIEATLGENQVCVPLTTTLRAPSRNASAGSYLPQRQRFTGQSSA
jgi:hypothetical protein